MTDIAISTKDIRAKGKRGRMASAIPALALGLAVMLGVPLASPAKAQASAAAQQIADHFSGVKSLAGSFVQFDANGRQTEGKFFIERPGKIRFDYTGMPLRVISDGGQVGVNNRKLNTWDLYPLSKTPLKLLLNQRIDLASANIESVKEEADLTTIVMGDKSVFGDSRITMMFDPASYDLRQWTIRDAQGKDTTVMIFDVKTGIALDEKIFEIPYTAIATGRSSPSK